MQMQINNDDVIMMKGGFFKEIYEWFSKKFGTSEGLDEVIKNNIVPNPAPGTGTAPAPAPAPAPETGTVAETETVAPGTGTETVAETGTGTETVAPGTGTETVAPGTGTETVAETGTGTETGAANASKTEPVLGPKPEPLTTEFIDKIPSLMMSDSTKESIKESLVGFNHIIDKIYNGINFEPTEFDFIFDVLSRQIDNIKSISNEQKPAVKELIDKMKLLVQYIFKPNTTEAEIKEREEFRNSIQKQILAVFENNATQMPSYNVLKAGFDFAIEEKNFDFIKSFILSFVTLLPANAFNPVTALPATYFKMISQYPGKTASLTATVIAAELKDAARDAARKLLPSFMRGGSHQSRRKKNKTKGKSKKRRTKKNTKRKHN